MGNFPLDSGDERDARSGHFHRTTDSDEAVGVVKLYRAGLFPLSPNDPLDFVVAARHLTLTNYLPLFLLWPPEGWIVMQEFSCGNTDSLLPV